MVGERVVPASVIREQRHLHAGSFVKPHARTIRVFVANCSTTIRSGFRLSDIYYYPFYSYVILLAFNERGEFLVCNHAPTIEVNYSKLVGLFKG